MSEENKNIEPCGNEENKESLESQEIIDSPEELKMQIKVDKNRTIEENGENLWQEIGQKSR